MDGGCGRRRKPMCTSEDSIPQTVGLYRWFVSIRDWLGRFPLSVIQFGMRIGVGMVFFKAGLLKYQSFEFAVKLFEDEYKLPFLAPAVAARMAMINELTTSTLLFLGLATRLTTLPLFGMISVIQIFVYPSAWPDHVLWGSILVFLLTRGPGSLSLDYLIERYFLRAHSEKAIPQRRTLLDRFESLREWLRRFPLSIVQLAMRIGVGLAFFSSGLLKYRSFDYATQLFEQAYRVPLLAPAVAARMAMINELTCSTLLLLGLATRLATLPLLAMILVLQIVYPGDWPDYVLWGSILIFLLTRGPGSISIDYLIERHFVKRG
jgi:putative oxidoreductase